MAAASIKQRFIVTNIGLLGVVPAAAPGGVTGTTSSDQQGVTLTATPIPVDPSQPTPAGVTPVQIPILDPAAKAFFDVGTVVEATFAVVVDAAAGAVASA